MYILLMFGEDMCYQTQMPLIFVLYFSDIGYVVLPTGQKNGLENQKSGL